MHVFMYTVYVFIHVFRQTPITSANLTLIQQMNYRVLYLGVFMFNILHPILEHFVRYPPKFNIAPENGCFQVRTLLFQGSIFRGELLVSGSVIEIGFTHVNKI